MMIERKVRDVSKITRRATIFLSNEIRNSNRIESKLLSNSLRTKKKIVEERNRTLKALYKSSIEDKKRKKGVGTLGLLGGGLLGRGLLRGFRPRVPSTPARLLRMQKGTSTLSRVGKFGRFGRIGPLAILGTGLDFAGRKAEGQTNLQAGLGAGGGLAGALAGGKYGAILGTAIGGPIGTVIGGIGGSIIGGLAGGRLADIFSGADRRRKFEIQRSLLATQKTLFSSALDDLDRVLDKFDFRFPDQDVIVVKKPDDDDGQRRPRFIPPKKIKDLFGDEIRQKSNARLLGEELAKYAAIAGVIFLLVPSDPSDLATTAPLSIKLMKLIKSTRLFRLFKKPPTELIPGKDIHGISAKGIQIRAEALLKKLNPNIKFDVPKKQPSLKELLIKEKQLQDKLYQIIKNASPEKAREILQKFIKEGKLDKVPKNKLDRVDTKVPRTIKKQGDVKVNVEKTFPSGSPDMTGTNSNPLGGFNKLSDASLEPSDNNNIALAPTNNIFLINQGNQEQQPPIIQGGDTTVVLGGGRNNTFENATKYAEITALMTV